MNSKKRIMILGAVLFISVALIIGVIAKFADSDSGNSVLTESGEEPVSESSTETSVLTKPDKDHNPDEKKIIFIGNSYSYYGNMVQTFTWDVSIKANLLNRFTDEKGGFYQLCKQNGEDFAVTNWTFGSHTLQDLFGGGCFDKNRHPGYDHLADLKEYSDMYYDYVVIQAPTGGAITNMEDYNSLLGYVCKIFRKANPDVTIIYSIPTLLYTQQDDRSTEIIQSIDEMIKKYDLIEANWGKLIADILSGKVTVENSTYEYTNNTFLVSKSADDGFHPNLLTGYINTQMIYSIITGETAVGEDYSFYTDASLGGNFDLQKVLNTYYTYDNISPAESGTKLKGDDLTNFPEIFASKTDMEGIQKLIDQYIKVNK